MFPVFELRKTWLGLIPPSASEISLLTGGSETSFFPFEARCYGHIRVPVTGDAYLTRWPSEPGDSSLKGVGDRCSGAWGRTGVVRL